MIAGLILAAGASRRFGAIKQLAQLEGRPLLAHAVDAMSGVEEIDEILVVLGSSAREIADAVDLTKVNVLVCDQWHEGMAAPLRAGVQRLAQHGADAVVITLADQPLITSEAIAAVIACAGPLCQGARATYGGRPGHPVLIKKELFAHVGELCGDVGAREILSAARLSECECQGIGSDRDFDTPDLL